MTGTNDGGITWAGVPANRKAIDADWIQISRHGDDGTIHETWAQMDLPKMMVQVGAMPARKGCWVTPVGGLCRAHAYAWGHRRQGGAIAMFTMMREHTPDMHIDVGDVIASGNKVAVRSTMTGTDTTGFMPRMAPTGKSFALGAIDVFSFDDAGMNTEHYGVYDVIGTMGQLGLLPDKPKKD